MWWYESECVRGRKSEINSKVSAETGRIEGLNFNTSEL